jgi:hypothetical protein
MHLPFVFATAWLWMGVAAAVVLCAMLYLLPAIIAYERRHPQKQAIFAVNLLLGWSFLGWAAAMIWAFVDPAPAR